jgi:cytochrome c2
MNPQGFVPGSTMVSPGVASRGDLDAILFYIKQVTR